MKRGARAVILRDRKILLGKRLKKDSFYGQWCTFGGFLKQGETARQALIRELWEELGIEAINPEQICVVEGYLPALRCKLRQHFFLVKQWLGVIANKSEHLEIGWFSKNQLKELPMGRVGKRVIEEHLEDLF
jgi:8-oxo-dGTP diphosphatase